MCMRSLSTCRPSTWAPVTPTPPNCAPLERLPLPLAASVPHATLRTVRRARSEWAVNQHRDSLALYVGFDSLSHYIAVAENESIGRVKFNCLQKMIHPCGPPPPKEDE
jgi:hypothetical protein